MTHFAQVIEGIVFQVIVAEQDFIDTLPDPTQWIQTSYNTHLGINNITGIQIRKNYAGIGFTYDEVRDAFIPPQIYNSWILNEETCDWNAPIPYPDGDKEYLWDEDLQEWVNTE